MNGYKVAQKGNIFVLTKEGYEYCRKSCRKDVVDEREVGKPVGEFTDYVPDSWLKKNWVKEVAAPAT